MTINELHLKLNGHNREYAFVQQYCHNCLIQINELKSKLHDSDPAKIHLNMLEKYNIVRNR